MTIRVAGEAVKLGDTLFSVRSQSVGTVVQVLDSTVILRVTRNGSTRDFTVTEGGSIAGEKSVYWHAPLALDLPKSQLAKVQKIQAVVDALVEVL